MQEYSDNPVTLPPQYWTHFCHVCNREWITNDAPEDTVCECGAKEVEHWETEDDDLVAEEDGYFAL